MKRFEHVQFAARTDVGKKRKNNEDALGTFPDAGIFCVADGMGGGDDGEIASAAVVKAVEDASKICVPPDEGGYAAADVADELENGLNKASEWIFNRTTDKKLSGCGSTFVGVVLDATHPDSALAVHAGDSRLYLLRGRSIKQITRDHSAAEMLGAKDESKLNPLFRSMVMNAVGVRAKVEPERTPFKIAVGDRILICSDGLSRMVPDKKILSISRHHAEVGEAADALIAAALEAGGIDNVTVLLVEIESMPEPAKAVPIAESAVDFMEGDTDTGSTDGSEAETEESTKTLQTIQPTLVRAKLDLGADAMGAYAAVQADNARKRRIYIAISAGIFLLVVIVGLLVKSRKGSEPSQMAAAEPVTNAVPQVVAVTPVTNAAPKKVAVVTPVTNAAPKKVAVAAPVTNAAPKKVAVAAPVTNAAPKKVAVAAPVTNIASKAIVVEPPKVEQNTVCTNLVAACADARKFRERMRRLFPRGNPPSDYLTLVEGFVKRADECSRGNVKQIEVVALEMRFMLQAAEEARADFKARAKSPEERQWLADWELIVNEKSNPKELSVQEACARLILSSKEVLAR